MTPKAREIVRSINKHRDCWDKENESHTDFAYWIAIELHPDADDDEIDDAIAWFTA